MNATEIDLAKLAVHVAAQKDRPSQNLTLSSVECGLTSKRHWHLPGFPGSPFAGESLFDAGGPFRIRRAQAVEQPIRADFQEL